MDVRAAFATLLSPEGRRDPYPVYEALRGVGPVVPIVDEYAVVTRYATVDRVLRDPAFRVGDIELLELRSPGWRDHPAVTLFAHSMLTANAPDHERMRRLVTREFSARRLADLRPAVERRAVELADRLAGLCSAGVPVDFITEFALPLPLGVIADLLGVPEADRAWFGPRAVDLTASLEIFIEGPDMAAADRAAVELSAFFTELADKRRREPRGDLISALARDDVGLSQQELIANLAVLLVAGFETITNLLGNGLTVLFAHPEAAARLRREPGMAGAYVEEMMRFEAPSQVTSRYTREATVLEGVRLPAYGQVLLLLGGANRDPSRYADPDRFDPQRPSIPSVAFGAGAHFCLGAALARLEAQIAFPLLLERFPGLRPAGEPIRHDRLTLRGYASLPVSVAEQALVR